MFSFRTTSIFEQGDNTLSRGRLAVLECAAAWYPEVDAHLWEILAGSRNVIMHIPADKLTLQALNDAEIDGLIIEYQPLGDRFDSFLGILLSLFSQIKEAGSEIAVYIADRFNPGGRQVEGVHRDGLPPKYGLTLGEVANMYYSDLNARFPLHIIAANATMAGRELMPWSIPPEHDFCSLFSSFFHCGQNLWKGTNVSFGEGTNRPFEFFGAPHMTALKGAEAVYNRGVFMRRCEFIPKYGRYAGEICHGFQLLPNPGEQYNSFLHALRLIRFVKDSCKEFVMYNQMEEIIGDDTIMAYLSSKCEWEELREYIKAEEQKWLRKAKKYLLYDDAPYRVK